MLVSVSGYRVSGMVDVFIIIIHLRLNNVQQSMEKPGTQAQLIKTRILYCWSREKSVLVLLVTREIRIMYSKSRALQQLCDSFVSETVNLD